MLWTVQLKATVLCFMDWFLQLSAICIKFLKRVCFKVFFTIADPSDANESLLSTNILFKYFHLSNLICNAVSNNPHFHLIDLLLTCWQNSVSRIQWELFFPLAWTYVVFYIYKNSINCFLIGTDRFYFTKFSFLKWLRIRLERSEMRKSFRSYQFFT